MEKKHSNLRKGSGHSERLHAGHRTTATRTGSFSSCPAADSIQGELLPDAVEREVAEETGISVRGKGRGFHG